ncbi:MAG: CBS domain-containing protein [Rhodospirillales bacterium]|nr:CBS domain-containing protein [Rhodospirillales bacterium]
MLVKDVMTPHAEWVNPEATLVELAKTMRDENIGCLPIGENDRLIGMVTDRDIAIRGIAEGGDPKTITARDVMTKNIKWCYENDDIDDAAHLMEDNKIRRLPVLNKDKRLVGLLALGDLSQKVSHELSGEVVEKVSVVHH